MATFSFQTTSNTNVTPNWTTGHHEFATPPEGCLVLGKDTGGFIPWDNPDNIISQETEQAADTAVGTVFLPVLFLISAPTNVLNMLVFWKQGLKERINLCLFYLSLVDFSHMFHAFVSNLDRFYLPFNTAVHSGLIFQLLVDLRLLGFRSLVWLSGCVSMLIACERCFCVMSPLRSQVVLKTRTMGVILVCVTAVCMTGSMLNGMRWSLVCMFDPQKNTTSMVLRTSQFYNRHRFHLDVVFLFYASVQPSVCVTVIMVTTLVTSVKLKAMMAWREETSSKVLSTREVTLTRMLIAASILYLICSLPTSILGTIVLFIKEINLNGRNYNLGMFVVSLFHLGGYINGTFNFFLYVSLGSKYRRTLRSLFHRFTFKSTSSDKSNTNTDTGKKRGYV